MSIHWNVFTPWSALAGGLLIGLATALFVLFNGRIAGIVGIVANLLRPASSDLQVSVAFLVGLIAAPLAYALVTDVPRPSIEAGTGALIVAGLLVGIGTRCGSGCTSGHGVCGLSRGSIRSLVATLAFMGAGMVTVYVVHHLIGH